MVRFVGRGGGGRLGLGYLLILMDLSTLHTFLYYDRVCGPHMNFRQVDREALAINPISSWSSWSSLAVVSFEELHRRYSMRTIFREMRKKLIPIDRVRVRY